jgi:site-specific recombinase XerD
MGYLKDNMIEEMKLRGYSDTTIKMYTQCVDALARRFMKSPLLITQAEIRDYFLRLIEESASPMRRKTAYFAVKLFYAIHGQPHYIDFLPRPRVPSRIPEVLDESEIQTILSLCRTLRYKLFFTLIYSSGLRISEALNIRLPDIDMTRRTIHVRESKSGKERYTILSSKAIVLLKFYLNRYRPESLLFFTIRDKSRKMPKRHCQQVFHDLVRQACITKKVRVHTLRHSFATHLLEHNTNIFYIMQLLGHASISSTLIYLHMQGPNSLKIQSPLDLSGISLVKLQSCRSQPALCSA